MEVERESMDYDVVVVGAGPSGLSTAIKLKQLNPEINVCVLEKGSEVGAHILSGNVFETRALDELIPDWRSKDSPIKTKVTKDSLKIFGNPNLTLNRKYIIKKKAKATVIQLLKENFLPDQSIRSSLSV